MVEQLSDQKKLKQKSIFCLALGPHKINSLDFPSLEKKYAFTKADGQTEQQHLSECSKGNPKISFEPWVDADRKSYFERGN